MAKPRKEQVRNLKSEYKVHGFAEISVSFGGATSQQVDDSQGQYTIFIDDHTYTKKLGGATENCPAFIRGISGPWTVPSGSAFTVQMSGYNNEQPVQVSIQPSDLVRNGNVSVLSAGKLAERINIALGLGSITEESQKCAYVDNGQFCMRSRNATEILRGSNAYITLANVTSGILGILGITSDTTVTSYGVDGPTRGVVTESADGLGGYVQLRGGLDKTTPMPSGGILHRSIWQDTSRTPVGWRCTYELDNEPRSPVHGRIRQSRTTAGASFQIQYFQNAKTYATVDFKLVNPGLIDSTDGLTIDLYGTSPGSVSTTTVAFTSSPNRTFSELVEEINAAWGVAQTNAENPRSARVVLPVESRFTFPRDASMKITFNGQNTSVTVAFPAGSSYNATQLAARINTAISTAGQSSQGTSVAGGTSGTYTVEIQSLLSTGSSSSIQVETSSELIAEVLGLTPGVYRGYNIASLVGGDTIRLQSPIRGGQMQIQTTGVNTASRGFNLNGSSSFTVSSDTGTTPAMPPLVDLSIPEMMEFWEVPDGISSQDAAFEDQIPDRPTLPQSGWANATVSSLIMTNGRIPSSVLPSSYSVLRAGLVQVQVTPDSGYISPKIQGFTGNGTGPNNILELRPAGALSASQVPIRMFASGNSVLYTVNAARNAENDALWYKDLPGTDSYFLEFKDGAISTGSYAPSAFTWANTAWSRNFAVDDAAQFASTVALGGRGNALSPDAPRLSVSRRNTTTGATPSGNNKFTLLMESTSNGSGALLPLRMYLTTSQNSLTNEANGFMYTVNARWDQNTGLWVRDVTSQAATAWIHGSQHYSGSTLVSGIYMFSMDVNTWTTWTKTGEFSNVWNNSTGNHTGTVRYGSNALDVLTPVNTIKAWSMNRCLSPTPSRIRSYNVNGLTRVNTGYYTWNYTNPVPALNCIQGSVGTETPGTAITNTFLTLHSNATTGSVSISNATVAIDNVQVNIVVLGSD